MLHLLAAALLGLCAGFMLCASAVGLTGHDMANAVAARITRTWVHITRPRPTPGQAVDAALARLATTPVDHPLAPTLDDLADDAAADPICTAALTGQPLDLHAHPFTCAQVVAHLESHGRSPRDARDTTAALFCVRPVALDKILAGGDQRRTTDAELAAALAPVSQW